MKCSSASSMKPRRRTMPGACARVREPGGSPCACFREGSSKSSCHAELARAWSNSSCPGTGAGSSVHSTCTGLRESQRPMCCQSRSIFRRSAGIIRLRYIESAGPPRIRGDGGTIRLAGPLDRPVLLRHALQRFTMKEAHATLGPWLSLLSAETDLRFGKIQIRRQRTRWGSCSRSGTISLNACLLFQPTSVVRYLLIHELAHTRHMNHSRRFWRLVEQHEPGWRELDAALTRGWREVPAWALG